MPTSLLTPTPRGLYCPSGDFYVDPSEAVSQAIVTHAHGDHAAPDCGKYLAAKAGLNVCLARLGKAAPITFLDYGESRTLGDVRVSLHPAGHILGSAQVRIEHDGEVWVVTGDYKRHADPTCRPFEPVRCHGLVTETTFGLPIFRWPSAESVIAEIEAWWRANQQAGKASLLYAYALGKAQRLLACIDSSIGPIYTHGAVQRMCEAYQADGVRLPRTETATSRPRKSRWSDALIVAPPIAHGTPWQRRLGDCSTAMASGWMRIRGIRRRRSVDRGFVISDHADWDEIQVTIRESNAEVIWATHGYGQAMTRYLREQGREAFHLELPNALK